MFVKLKYDVGSMKCESKRTIENVYFKRIHTSYIISPTSQIQTPIYIGVKMINIFVRVLILYILVLIIMRLMGKRELRRTSAI